MLQAQSYPAVSAKLAERFRSMPKAEIHIHIEGATRPATFYQLAQRNGVALPVSSLEDWQSFFEFRDFRHFIRVYTAAVQCLQTPDDYELLIEDFYHRQAGQNILYTEAFLSATFITRKFTDDAILDAIARGMAAGKAKHHVAVRLIPDISREDPDSQTRVLKFVLNGKERGLFIGLGVGGMESGFPAQLFRATFAQARQEGLRVVAHAGEAAGADSVWGAVNDLHAERIGHGIRCLEDPRLVERLRQLQIPLEVSPQSNYCLDVVDADQPHPIRRLVDAGLYCTVNSDDPAMFSTCLAKEYATLASQGFTWDELWRLNLNTLEASFLNEAEKASYRIKWEQFLSTVN